MILEVCVDSYTSLATAQKAGADRIELCAALNIGGLTPSYGLMMQAKTFQNLEIFAMIRPRSGDFLYDENEFETMKQDIRLAKEVGLDGIVTGILKPDGKIDLDRMQELVKLALPLKTVLHRAFDDAENPIEDMESLIKMGVIRILTSGQRKNALEGAEFIKNLQEKFGSRIEIMPGCGVNDRNIQQIYDITRCTNFHLSGRANICSKMQYRECLARMNTSKSEFDVFVASYELIKNAREIMNSFIQTPKFIPELDKEFRPISLENRAYRTALKSKKEHIAVKIAIVGEDGFISTTATKVFADNADKNQENKVYIERLVKSLIWIKGGFKIIFGGPSYIGEYLKDCYRVGGSRDFDAVFMGNVYNNTFTVETTDYKNVPDSSEQIKSIGRHLDGCRIGFDAGGSDRKVSAVVDGEAIYSEEVVWHPKTTADPQYHFDGILDSMQRAAEKMPRVDAIGISSAGIYINNETRAASLFRVVSKEDFDKRIRRIYYDVAKKLGDIPIEVANDGDVTALAGAMSMNENCILGIAMGTSEAVGYVDGNGNITGWLNELAFVPVDLNEKAAMDEWSLDYGVGVSYFSQDAVIKLAPNAKIELDSALSPADKLKVVQKLMEADDDRAKKIYETIGIYLGYAIAYYADFYDINKVLLLGRVTSGKGGSVLIENACEVLAGEFPELSGKITLVTPNEEMKRVGQSIAAASLPYISK